MKMSDLSAVATGALALACIASSPTEAEITPDQVREFRESIADRIEALTILGGDFGFSGGELDRPWVFVG